MFSERKMLAPHDPRVTKTTVGTAKYMCLNWIVDIAESVIPNVRKFLDRTETSCVLLKVVLRTTAYFLVCFERQPRVLKSGKVVAQLLVAVCLLVAVKQQSQDVLCALIGDMPALAWVAWVTDDLYTVQEARDMEASVLNVVFSIGWAESEALLETTIERFESEIKPARPPQTLIELCKPVLRGWLRLQDVSETLTMSFVSEYLDAIAIIGVGVDANAHARQKKRKRLSGRYSEFVRRLCNFAL